MIFPHAEEEIEAVGFTSYFPVERRLAPVVNPPGRASRAELS
jgi:hypothetical protein